jgi:hypothetical protein
MFGTLQCIVFIFLLYVIHSVSRKEINHIFHHVLILMYFIILKYDSAYSAVCFLGQWFSTFIDLGPIN